MYTTHPRCGFPRPIARQPRGCQYGTIRLSSEISRRGVSDADLVGTRCAIVSVGIPRHGKSAQEGVIYTVVYGIALAGIIVAVWTLAPESNGDYNVRNMTLHVVCEACPRNSTRYRGGKLFFCCHHLVSGLSLRGRRALCHFIHCYYYCGCHPTMRAAMMHELQR